LRLTVVVNRRCDSSTYTAGRRQRRQAGKHVPLVLMRCQQGCPLSPCTCRAGLHYALHLHSLQDSLPHLL
jgi:hypothetical protein